MDQATVAVDAGDVPANGLTTASGDSDIDLSDDEAPARPRLAFPKAPVAETADVNAPADEVASAVGDDAADQMDQPTEATAEDAALAEPTGGGLLDDSASDDSDGDRIPRYKKKSKSKKRAASDEGSGRDDDDDDDDDDFNEGDAEAKKRRKAEKRRKKDRAARAGKRGRDELGDEEMRMLDEGDAQEEVIDEETSGSSFRCGRLSRPWQKLRANVQDAGWRERARLTLLARSRSRSDGGKRARRM
jgi:hypothetical protein